VVVTFMPEVTRTRQFSGCKGVELLFTIVNEHTPVAIEQETFLANSSPTNGTTDAGAVTPDIVVLDAPAV